MQPIERLHSCLEESRAAFLFSGAQAWLFHSGKEFELSVGKTSYWKSQQPVDRSTWFDIGSVTKPIVTTSLVALATQEKRLNLNDPLSKFIGEVDKTFLKSVTIESFLNHSTGLKGWCPLYREVKHTEAFLDWLSKNESTAKSNPPDQVAEYSDLGFILLGILVERIYQKPLAVAFAEHVIRPLRLEQIAYGPIDDPNTAATEFCLQRKELLKGRVFDENCDALGGIAGHAGLFSNAKSVGVWAVEWLRALKGKSQWLKSDTARLFVKKRGRVGGSTWALGWDTKSSTHSSAGSHFSSDSFGHLGYPGCSVWVDPVKETVAVLNTNRVHPSRLDLRIREFRPKFHDEVFLALNGVKK